MRMVEEVLETWRRNVLHTCLGCKRTNELDKSYDCLAGPLEFQRHRFKAMWLWDFSRTFCCMDTGLIETRYGFH